MNEQAPVEKKQGRRSRTGSDRTRYTYEEKLRAVKLLQQWQERAMEGMLQALEPRVNLADGGALSPRIRALLEKRQLPVPGKLLGRLEQLQEIAPETKTPSTG